MYLNILIESLEQNIKDCESRISYYKQELENNPGDMMFEAALKRAEANKAAFEWQLAEEKQRQ